MLSESDVAEVARAAGLGSGPVVTLVKENNHVYRIESGGRAFYLKTFTKDWYRGCTTLETNGCVDHEAGAFRLLAKHGLNTPRVVVAEMTCDNALERPFILMEALRGWSLTQLLGKADRLDFARLLRATGEYMARMHAIAFRFPGYISSTGAPAQPPNPDTWGHPIWTFSEFEKLACRQWERDAADVPPKTVAKAREFYSAHEAAMRAAYEPPHFTHGDCHAHQFFLDREDGRWVVTGVVDMEVSSSGDAEADFGKLAEILPGEIPAATRWWEPLFEGYGREPSLELLKLRMAACGLGGGGGIGYHPWPGTRGQVLAHILSARSWFELFDLRELRH